MFSFHCWNCPILSEQKGPTASVPTVVWGVFSWRLETVKAHQSLGAARRGGPCCATWSRQLSLSLAMEEEGCCHQSCWGGGGLSRPTGDPWRWWEGPSGGSESSVLAEIPSTPAKPLLIQLTKDCLFKFNFNFFPFREISWLQIKSNTLPVLQSLIPLTPYPKPIRFRLHHAF